MTSMNAKYHFEPSFKLAQHQWPNNTLAQAPRWLSLDLASAARALVVPLDLHQRLQLFQLLQKIGVKEIAVGMPGIYENEAAFLQRIINDQLIQNDVTIQVTTTTDSHCINKTLAAIKDQPRAIIQLQIATSEAFRKLKHQTKEALLAEIKNAATLIQENRQEHQLAISLEGFTATEPDFILAIWQIISEIWQPTALRKVIFHCPATLIYGSVNHYADYIEYLSEKLPNRDSIVLSVAAQNNRGTAVAAIECALLAGAERVAGSLAGIGERSGIADIITLALNLQSQGIDPKLNLSNCHEITDIVNDYSLNQIPMRHPYLGEFAFSAVKKAQHELMRNAIEQSQQQNQWSVPYLSIDPLDLGRAFETINTIQPEGYEEDVIRTLEDHFGFHLPKLLQAEFCEVVYKQEQAENKKLTATEINQALLQNYTQGNAPFLLQSINFEKQNLYGTDELLECNADIQYFNDHYEIKGSGNGAIDTLANAIKSHFNLDFDISYYAQHALTQGTNAMAATYIKIIGKNFHSAWGLGIDNDSTLSGIKAFMNALNRALREN